MLQAGIALKRVQARPKPKVTYVGVQCCETLNHRERDSYVA